MLRTFATVWSVLLLMLTTAASAADVVEWQTAYDSGGVAIPIEGFAPAGAQKAPVILLLHGSGGLEQGTRQVFLELAHQMAQQGYLALVPHYFERTGRMPGAPAMPDELDRFAEAIRDAITFLAKAPEADAQRVGLFGFSLGAAVASSCAANEPRVRAVCSCSAVAPAAVPTLFLIGGADRSVSTRELKLATDGLTLQKIPNASHVYRGEAHAFTPATLADAGRRTIAFFDKHVRKSSANASKTRRKAGKVKVVRTAEQYQSGGKAVSVECFAPQSEGKHPLVVALHGEGGFKPAQFEALPNTAQLMARSGYYVIVPHYFECNGHEAGKPATEAEREQFVAAIADAIAFAQGKPEVDTDRMGIFGFSDGARVGAECARRDARVRALASVASVVPTDGLPATLLLVGARDTVTPSTAINRFREAMDAAHTPHGLHVYAGVRHDFRPAEFYDAGDRAAAFFDEHLQAPEPDTDQRFRTSP